VKEKLMLSCCNCTLADEEMLQPSDYRGCSHEETLIVEEGTENTS
jgi:hypothetical protein